MFASNVTGREGEIRIPGLGAVIGQLMKWSLVREVVGDTPTGKYIFRADLKYINQALFNDTDYLPQVIITTAHDRKKGTKRQYRLELADGRRPKLNGRSLLMEGVTLWEV